MKIAMFADPHGRSGLRAAEKDALALGCDAAIVVGDIYDPNDSRKIPFHLIRGNHEIEKEWLAQGGTNVFKHEDYSVFELGGLKFGVIGRMNEKDYWRLRRIGFMIGNVKNAIFKECDYSHFRGCDVLLFHDAVYPFLIDGDCGGSEFLAEVVKKIRPKWVFHGHMHVFQEYKHDGIDVISLSPCDTSFHKIADVILDTETCMVEIKL